MNAERDAPGELPFEDERWATLRAGYRVPIDLRPLLLELTEGDDPEGAWNDLWQELVYQGRVGEGSFVAVPHLVRIHRERNQVDRNTYALVAAIELARNRDGNPDVPAWARAGYDAALRELAPLALTELPLASDRETVRAILAMLAILHGARTYGRMISEFSERELLELEKQAFDPQGPLEP